MQMRKFNLTIIKKNEIKKKKHLNFKILLKQKPKIGFHFLFLKILKRRTDSFFKGNSGDVTCQISNGVQKRLCKKRKEINLSTFIENQN